MGQQVPGGTSAERSESSPQNKLTTASTGRTRRSSDLASLFHRNSNPHSSRRRDKWRRALCCAGFGGRGGDASSGPNHLTASSIEPSRQQYLRRLGISKGREANLPRPSSKPDLDDGLFEDDLPQDLKDLLCDLATDKLGSVERQNSFSSTWSTASTVLAESQASSNFSISRQASSNFSFRSTPSSSQQLSPTNCQDHQGDNARMKFLQKLSYEGVWLPRPQRPPSHQTLIIFDWDDTLVPTTFMNKMEGCHLSETVEAQLQACEDASAKLLQLALSLGQTFIITNALENWVESSAEFWAPSLCPLIQRINVVSARSRYEEQYPHLPMKWKAETFLDVRKSLDSQVVTNIISLGDSEYEMEATQAMGKEFQQASIKLIKFTESPCPEELLKQLELVIEEFERIVGKAQNVRVRLQRPKAPN
jgi:hypothetical protein